MATLAQVHSFAIGNPALQVTFQAARLQVAWNILAESAGTTNHAARLVWAQKIFTDYASGDLDKEYRWFLSHANVQAAGSAITDANAIAAVASFVDSWSA